MSTHFHTDTAASSASGSFTEVTLRKNELRKVYVNKRWRLIVCLDGIIWLTQPSDLNDYVLTPGEIFLATKPGTVLVQALRDARMQISPSRQVDPYIGRISDSISK